MKEERDVVGKPQLLHELLNELGRVRQEADPETAARAATRFSQLKEFLGKGENSEVPVQVTDRFATST